MSESETQTPDDDHPDEQPDGEEQAEAETEEQPETDADDAPEPTDNDDAVLSVIAEQSVYDRFLDRIGAVVDEAVLQIGPDGIGVEAVDPANVGMVDTRIDPADCEHYDSGRLAIGVSLERLADAIGLADDGDDLVELQFDADDWHFAVLGPDFEFGVAGLTPDSVRDPPDVPENPEWMEFEADVAGSKLARAVRGCDMVSDHVAVSFDPEGGDDGDGALSITAEGDVDGVDFEWSVSDMETVGAVPDERIESLLALPYLSDMVAPMDDDEPVHIELGDSKPAWFSQPYSENGRCVFMLAPRIPSQ